MARPVRPADPAYRRKALTLVAALAVLGALAIGFGLPALREYIESGSGSGRVVLVLDALGTALALPLVVLGVITYRLGRRTVTASAFPPPGLAVLRDTVELSGRDAQRLGTLASLLGLALVVTGAAIPFFMHMVATRLGG